jgi:tetratricopeptide (TPR) repeat protein
MRYSLFAILLFLFSSCTEETDLNHEVGLKDVDARLNHYWDLYEAHKASTPDSALYFMQEIKIMAKNANKVKWLGAAYGAIGDIHRNQGNLGESTYHYLKAIKLFKELGELNRLAVFYTNLGVIYESIEDYEKAISYCMQAKDIFFYEGSNYEKANTYRNLALYHSRLNQFGEAEEFLHLAKKTAIEGNNYLMLSQIYNISGFVNFKQKQYDKARENYQMAIQNSDSTADGLWVKAMATNNISETYLHEKKYAQAEEWLNKTSILKKEINDPIFSQSTLNLYGKMLIELGKNREAADLLLNNFGHAKFTQTSPAIDEGLSLAQEALTRLAAENQPENATELARKFATLNAYSKEYTLHTRQLREELHTLSKQLAVKANVSRYTHQEEAQEAARKNLQIILFSMFLLVCSIVALGLVMRKNRRYKKLYAKVEDILNSQALRHMKKR